MIGELFKETSRRRVASSKGGEMIRIFKIVEQHVAFQIFVTMLGYEQRAKVCCASEVFSCEV